MGTYKTRPPVDGRRLPTDRMRDVYGYIFATMQREGCRPTLRDIADRFGIGSSNGVVCHLRGLALRGFIEFTNRDASGRHVSVTNHYKILRLPDGRPFHGFVPRDEPTEPTEPTTGGPTP